MASTSTRTRTNSATKPLAGLADAVLNASELSRVVEMAWEDRTPLKPSNNSSAFNESAVIRLMRAQLKPRSFRLWRQRVTGRKTKHLQLRSPDVARAYCPTQYKR